MKKRVMGMAVVGLAGLVGSSALAAAPSAYLRPGRTELVDVSSVGAHAQGVATPSQFENPASDLSADGRYVVFQSESSNLVAGDTNQVADVFRRDRQTGRTVRVSTSSADAQALSPAGSGSGGPAISRNGRYVVFMSDAVNLVPGDTNLSMDVFEKDMATGQLTRVSLTDKGAQIQGPSFAGDVSDDGRFVGFSSYSIIPQVSRTPQSVYVRDLKAKRTTLVTVGLGGAASNGDSGGGSVSADGRYVAFASYASNLVAGDTNGARDVFWRDLKTGRTQMASAASDGTPARFGAVPLCGVSADPGVPLLGTFSYGVCTSLFQGWTANHISADGQYVTFSSNATNLVPNDDNYTGTSQGFDTFVRNMFTGRTERVSVTSVGHERTGLDALYQAVSDTGRYVTFTDVGTGGCSVSLPAGACPSGFGFQATTAEIYDRLSGALEPVVPGSAPGPAGPCTGQDRAVGGTRRTTESTALSADGRIVSFFSSRPDLVPGDTNRACDFFIRDRGASLGVGTLLESGASTGGSSTPDCLVTEPLCVPSPAAPVNPAGELLRASLLPRPFLGDLFLRWDLARLTPIKGAPSGGLLYGLTFTVNGVRYQVRAQRVPGFDYDAAGGASFGLFRETSAGLWTKFASLSGGYGTIGDSVVTAVPMSLLRGKAQLTNVTAYTAVGSYLSGPTKVLDSLRLSR